MDGSPHTYLKRVCHATIRQTCKQNPEKRRINVIGNSVRSDDFEFLHQKIGNPPFFKDDCKMNFEHQFGSAHTFTSSKSDDFLSLWQADAVKKRKCPVR